jgi:hypothetical protein
LLKTWSVPGIKVCPRYLPIFVTNRVFGETDAGHSTYPVNLETGRQDYVNGVTLHPKHIPLALRKYLGIHSNQYASSFPLERTEDFAFFS